MAISVNTNQATNYAQGKIWFSQAPAESIQNGIRSTSKAPQNGLRSENELHFPKEPQSVEDFLNSIKEADKISINDQVIEWDVCRTFRES